MKHKQSNDLNAKFDNLTSRQSTFDKADPSRTFPDIGKWKIMFVRRTYLPNHSPARLNGSELTSEMKLVILGGGSLATVLATLSLDIGCEKEIVEGRNDGSSQEQQQFERPNAQATSTSLFL